MIPHGKYLMETQPYWKPVCTAGLPDNTQALKSLIVPSQTLSQNHRHMTLKI